MLIKPHVVVDVDVICGGANVVNVFVVGSGNVVVVVDLIALCLSPEVLLTYPRSICSFFFSISLLHHAP